MNRALILVPLNLLTASAGILVALAHQPGADLAAEFDRRRLDLHPGPTRMPLTEADIAGLPDPVRAYVRWSGAIGKPPVTMVHTTFEARLHRTPGDPGMVGPAHQIDVLDPPRRLFFMTTQMRGLPVAVLHDYAGETGSMRVRLARLLDVTDVGGSSFARSETVTFFNDLCVFAPSALIRPEFEWTAIDDRHAGVTFTLGEHRVSAILTFDAEGYLVDFASEDRGELQPDGAIVVRRWTTPLSTYAEFQGRHVATRGSAVWHREDGPFTYGTFRMIDVSFNEVEVPSRVCEEVGTPARGLELTRPTGRGAAPGASLVRISCAQTVV